MLLSIEETITLIENQELLILAADEKVLNQLPKGNWIAGTIPYFMDQQGGVHSKEKIFVTEVNQFSKKYQIKTYDAGNIKNIANDAFENGFTFLIIPASSEVHFSYAQNAPSYPNIFLKPIIGWISGLSLDEVNQKKAKVFNGQSGEEFEKQAICIHFSLPENLIPSIEIINIFNQGDGDTIKFENNGFHVTDCLINGKKTNLFDYINSKNINKQLPLVADYLGTKVNVSFQNFNENDKSVDFYAPVFKDVKYKAAQPIDNYVLAFEKAIHNAKVNMNTILFSCNCILNYAFGELEGKITPLFYGPITFGEIAYQLLNQTLVYLQIIEK